MTEIGPLDIWGHSAGIPLLQDLSIQANGDVTVYASGQDVGLRQFLKGSVDAVVSLGGFNLPGISTDSRTCVDPYGLQQVIFSAQLSALTFNLPEVDALTLDSATVSSIYRGEITRWDDPAIIELNPGAKLPQLSITPIYRADRSEINTLIQGWLEATVGNGWVTNANWAESIGLQAFSTADMRTSVAAAEGGVGYLDFATADGLAIASLRVGKDNFWPSGEAILDHLPQAMADPGGPHDYLLANAYPLVRFLYLLTCLEYQDEDTGTAVRQFITAALEPAGQALFATKHTGVDLSGELLEQQLALVQSIR